ncbi:MAG: polyprenyl synthetase family protein [Spirochaetes bacterium]|nr:polyprenyl synthetase family protein [Spirochaetota bacterium]MBU1081788.1 polyprenyl synthetase family protein [Spirochaetota bacterium]
MTEFWKELPEISAKLDAVRARMKDVVGSGRFPLAEPVQELIDANGKMLRPAFLIMAGRFGKRPKDLTDLAAAVELLHVATLIHDDVIDASDTRRGIPTVHSRYGAKDAVLAGDWLFSRCFRLASESSSPENARLLAALIGALCSEEIHQDLERYSWPRSERNYLRKIAGKTAALFSLSLRAGAVEAKASPSTVAALTRAGYAAGMAFQVMDDVLDYESSEGAMRKPVASDVREGLCTLPLILAMRAVPGRFEPLLAAVGRGLARPDDAAIGAIVDAVRESGAISSSRDLASAYTGRAMRELSRLPPGTPRDELRGTVERLLSRDY